MPSKKPKPSSTSTVKTTTSTPKSFTKPKSASSALSIKKSTTKDVPTLPDWTGFEKVAAPLTILIGDVDGIEEHFSLTAQVKHFSTGAYGWELKTSEELPVGEDGQMMDVTISLTINVKGSKKAAGSKPSKSSAKASSSKKTVAAKTKKRKAVDRDGDDDDEQGQDENVGCGDESESGDGSEE